MAKRRQRLLTDPLSLERRKWYQDEQRVYIEREENIHYIHKLEREREEMEKTLAEKLEKQRQLPADHEDKHQQTVMILPPEDEEGEEEGSNNEEEMLDSDEEVKLLMDVENSNNDDNVSNSMALVPVELNEIGAMANNQQNSNNSDGLVITNNNTSQNHDNITINSSNNNEMIAKKVPPVPLYVPAERMQLQVSRKPLSLHRGGLTVITTSKPSYTKSSVIDEAMQKYGITWK